jgi:hypothetical protein
MDELGSFLTQDEAPSPALRTIFPSAAVVALVVGLCVLLPTLLVALEIDRNPKFSPIDEAAHWDYVQRVADGEVPRLGERLRPSTLRELVCRGTDLEGLLVPNCDAPRLRYGRFPGGGEQYEAQQPPIYYAITVPLRWLGREALGLDDVDATRTSGLVWLVAGLLLLWCTGRLLGLGVAVLASVVLLLVTAPLVIYHASVVSNDAASVFCGSLVAFTAALSITRPGRWRTWLLLAVGFFVVFIKTTNGMSVLAVSGLLLAGAWVVGRDDRLQGVLRRWMPTGGALLIGGALAAAVWIVVHRSRSLINPTDLATFDILRQGGFGPTLILKEALSLFGPLVDAYVPVDTLGQKTQAVMAGFLRYLLVGAALAALFVSPRRWPHVLGLTSLGALYVGGVLFGIGIWLNYDVDPSVSGRYGLSVGPLLVLVLAGVLRGTWARLAVWALGLAYATQTLVVLLA